MTSMTKGLVLSGFDIRVTGGFSNLALVIERDGESWEGTDAEAMAVLPVFASGAWRDAPPCFDFRLLPENPHG